MKCKKIWIPKDACMLHFGKDRRAMPTCDGTIDLFTTRGEQMFIHIDDRKDVVAIELLGSPKARKPCQETDKRGKPMAVEASGIRRRQR